MKTLVPLGALLVVPLFAQTRSSADYSMTGEGAGPGVPSATSADYTADSAGQSSGGSPGQSADFVSKPGYVGQLYDVTAVSVSATPDPVGEGATSQLSLEATLDDLSSLIPSPSTVAWQVLLGPVDSIDSAGLLTAGAVYEDTPATIHGTYQGVTGSGGLTILDSDPDNFAGYAGDGVRDAWQVDNFGAPPNVLAGPTENPDGDLYDNLFESLTGSDPNDPGDFLRFILAGRSSGLATIRLSKVIPGTVYTVKRSPDLGSTTPYAPFPSSSFTTVIEQADYEVVDAAAAGPRQFYVLEVAADE